MSPIGNERTKMTATYLNGSAVAVRAVGGLAPVVSAANTGAPKTLTLAFSTTICVFATLI